MNRLLREEAVQRQGTTVLDRFAIEGDAERAYFESGGEGLVQRALDLQTGQKCRIKCFWHADQQRLERSKVLVEHRLADTLRAQADALGGAPYEIIERLGPQTPFALVMKDVRGRAWRQVKEYAADSGKHPLSEWPKVHRRATWGYGLATAVRDLEARDFVHADISDGNVVVDESGDFALVDFDGFALPKRQLESPCFGSAGYSAPELWNRQHAARNGRRGWFWKKRAVVGRGTDRLGLALLVQEFLLMGHVHLPADAAYGWSYSQVEDLCLRQGQCHPALASEFPEIAPLMNRALKAQRPESRPSPEEWRRALKPISDGDRCQERFVLVPQHPGAAPLAPLPLTKAAFPLNLTQTSYGIRATIEHAHDGSLIARVHAGATLFARVHNVWTELSGYSQVQLDPGVALLDRSGQLSARVAFEGQP